MKLMNYETSNGKIIVEGMLPDDLRLALGKSFVVGVWRHTSNNGDPAKLPAGTLTCYDNTDSVPYAPVEKQSALLVKPTKSGVVLYHHGTMKLPGMVYYFAASDKGETYTGRFLHALADLIEECYKWN